MPPKRRLGVDPSNIIDGDARGKRRKESDAQLQLESSSPVANIETTAEPDGSQTNVANLDPLQISELGLRIWNAVKETKGKEEQDLSFDFMRLPSKRQYADYFIIIKHPICLDDIKVRLEGSQYPNLEAVKQDFDLCFKNARKYNVKESGIYKAAKTLQKVVSTVYAKLTGSEEEDVDVVGDEVSGDEGDKKRKRHSLSRTLKSKLNKLTEKADDSGRLLSGPFMEPPDKKLYADYYKIIKKVMCFEMIYKKIKRKEYGDASAFAADVELIFSNAIEYNADHSMLWEDAHTLRDYFHKLMATLPPDLSGTMAGTQTMGKIKLKLPGSVAKHDPVSAPDMTGSSTSLTLKLPASGRPTTHTAAPIIENNELKLPPVQTIQATQAEQSTASSPAPAGKPLLTTQPTVPATTSVGSRSVFPVKSASPAPNAPNPPQTKQSTPQLHSYTPSPAPPELPLKHPIGSLLLQTTPHGRTFHLDRDEGVRLWAVRLGMGERGIRVSRLHFMDELNASDGEEDEEDEETGDDESSSNISRRRGAGKEKHGVRNKASNSKREKDTVSKKSTIPDATVRLNGAFLRPTVGAQPTKSSSESRPMKQWQGELPVGPSSLEVRAGDAGEIWKIYLERQSG